MSNEEIIYGTQKQRLRNLSTKQVKILRQLCSYSASLYNIALKNIKNSWQKDNVKLVSYHTNCQLCIDCEEYRMLNSRFAQQTLKQASLNFSSFVGLINKYSKGDYHRKGKINFPSFQGEYYDLILRGNNIMSDMSKRRGWYKIPLSGYYKQKTGVKTDWIKVPIPTNLLNKQLKQIRIVPKNQGRDFILYYNYLENKKKTPEFSIENCMGIDLGVSNFATCVFSNDIRPFIIDGKRMKSINQYWKKEDAKCLSLLKKQHLDIHSKKRYRLAERRNNQIDAIIKSACQYVISQCLENNITTIIVGHNKGIKQEMNFDKVNAQNFKYLPYTKFMSQLRFLCDKMGINYVEQEESYTSKSSFIDSDILPMMPTDYNWNDNFTGKRVHRGLYQSKEGILINADVNGAYNIIRKYTQDFNIERLNSGGLEPPVRIRF